MRLLKVSTFELSECLLIFQELLIIKHKMISEKCSFMFETDNILPKSKRPTTLFYKKYYFV